MQKFLIEMEQNHATVKETTQNLKSSLIVNVLELYINIIIFYKKAKFIWKDIFNQFEEKNPSLKLFRTKTRICLNHPIFQFVLL